MAPMRVNGLDVCLDGTQFRILRADMWKGGGIARGMHEQTDKGQSERGHGS